MAVDLAGASEILTYAIGDNSVGDYLFALLAFILTIAVLKIFKTVMVNKLKKIAAKTKTKLDDLLIKTVDGIGWPFYVVLALYIGAQFIQLTTVIQDALYYMLIIVATYYAVKVAQSLIDYVMHRLVLERRKEDKKADVSVIKLLNKVLKGVLWVVALLLILSNLGYDISTLIAGLGIGGLAVALALQNVLTDIFASFSIYFDKPFKIGDFVVVGDDSGTVRKIGIKTSRIKTLKGDELVISNKELTESRIHNYGRMKRRRVPFNIGVTYDTSSAKLKKIPGIIKSAINKVKLADFDRAHFKEFGDFSLKFEIVYYVNSGDYNKYMDVQQKINLEIKKRFEKEGIEMAYPTQTIFLNKAG